MHFTHTSNAASRNTITFAAIKFGDRPRLFTPRACLILWREQECGRHWTDPNAAKAQNRRTAAASSRPTMRSRRTLRMNPPEYGAKDFLVEHRERFVFIWTQPGPDLDDARDSGV